MTVRQLREKYLAFFVSKGHLHFPSGSVIPYDVTGRLDESLLFNGAGMVQFKPFFRGTAKPEKPRLTTAQKCVRTGDIEEVGDAQHLTFFEMMGNFSFGDYFRAEAIHFSWEFLTSSEWLGLDPGKLAFTVFEQDDEAFDLWAGHLSSCNIEPATRIFRLGEESNYWPAGSLSNGPPGPCGPNSEMFFWKHGTPPSGRYTTEEFLRDDASGKWVEIWNDVFIGSEWKGHLKDSSRPALGYVKEGAPDLPFKSVDTGMGLERTAMVLGGFDTVYDSDAFSPILSKIRARSGPPSSPERLVAERVVADHVRTSCICIADGVFPSNAGRGYVLRRLIRRAVLKGQRVLGFDEPFLSGVSEGVVEAMGDFYQELRERKETIQETLSNEEAQFTRTLASGEALLEAELSALAPLGTLPGAVAFRLYDTFGFPLEVTTEMAQERGFAVDIEGYEVALKEAQTRSRAGQERESVYGGVGEAQGWTIPEPPEATEFVGYTLNESEAKVARVRALGKGKLQISLDRTPLYAESGGQVGDQGVIEAEGFSIRVLGTSKKQSVFWHDVDFEGDPHSLLGLPVSVTIDESRRRNIQRNHTATHLLHAALRATLGPHVAQAGSFVGPDSLRFDFSHNRSLSGEELSQVEALVNQEVLKNIAVVTHVDLPIEEARAKGAMALFGEKYGATVRMVEIGAFSRELCGGTHVAATGEVGLFKIVSEGSAAGGIRRIEAITGEATYRWTNENWRRLKEASALLRSTPPQIVASVERLIDQLRDERQLRERAELSAMRAGSADGSSHSETRDFQDFGPGGVKLWVKNFGQGNPKMAAGELDNFIAETPSGFGLVASVSGEKVSLFAKAGKLAVERGAHSGELVRSVATALGGSGGGRAEFASAGAKLASNLAEVLATAPDQMKSMLKQS